MPSATAAPPGSSINPDVSVLIPTFHREEAVVQAVRSVLGSCPFTLEVIVADDSPEGSAAAAVKSVEDVRVRYVHRDQPTGGVPAQVRNDLVAQSRGRYLYFLDDDDTVSLDALSAVVARMEASGLGVGIGAVCPFGPEGSAVVIAEQLHYAKARRLLAGLRNRYEMVARLLFMTPTICCSACVIRRDAFDAIGGFDTSLPLYEDIEMYIRAIRRFGFTFVDQDFLHRRTGMESLIQNERDSQRTLKSYQLIYASYRRHFGWIEWGLLRVWALLLRRRRLSR